MNPPSGGSIGANHRTLRQAVTDQIQEMISSGDLAWTTDTANPIDIGQDVTDLGELVLVQVR